MRTLILLCTAFTAASFAQTPAPSPSLKTTGKFYELRIYHAMPGKLEEVHARFRNHTNALFVKSHGCSRFGGITAAGICATVAVRPPTSENV